ncbi:MAG: flagellar motor switch protein FliN [Sphingopyxis sp.]
MNIDNSGQQWVGDGDDGANGAANGAANGGAHELSGGALATLGHVAVRLSVEVGSTALRLSQLMELTKGSVVELDRQVHELLDIMANGTLIARGEVVTANGRYAIRVTEVADSELASRTLERRQ